MGWVVDRNEQKNTSSYLFRNRKQIDCSEYLLGDCWKTFRWILRYRRRRCEVMDEYVISSIKHSHSAIIIYFCVLQRLRTYSTVFASLFLCKLEIYGLGHRKLVPTLQFVIVHSLCCGYTCAFAHGTASGDLCSASSHNEFSTASSQFLTVHASNVAFCIETDLKLFRQNVCPA